MSIQWEDINEENYLAVVWANEDKVGKIVKLFLIG